MSLYYDQDGIVIYNDECHLLIDELEYDMVLTDPPYGISAVQRGKTFGTSNACAVNVYDPVHGDDEPFDPSFLISSRPTVIWGANHFASRLPDSSCWLVWDKRDGLNSNPLADCELAWTNLPGPARLFSHRWMGMVKASEHGERWHPTQKPLRLMSWALNLMPDGLVLDPFMGSGSTLVAAKNLGRRAIGIEIEERYCEIAARRLSQQVLGMEVA